MSSVPTKAQRKAQSARDKAKAQGRQKPTGNRLQKQPKASKKQKRRNRRDDGVDAIDHEWSGAGAIYRNDAGTRLQHAAPQMTDIIEKDEFVSDVLGSGGTGTTVVTKFAFNPGLATLFPVGSAEAAKWTCWKCIGAEPYLLHEVSEFATDGSTGKVGLSFDYDAANDTPTTKQQLEVMHSASCMPSEDIGLKLIPRLLNRADPKYVRVGVKPGGTDIRLYDGGNLFVWAAGQAGTTKVSELHIRYKFQMCLPTLLNPTGGLADDASISWFQSSAAETSGTTGVAVQMLYATATGNGLGIVNTAGSFVPPAGNYHVTAVATCSVASSMSKLELNVLKNAATVYAGAALHPTHQNTTAVVTTATLVADVVVSANGTDAFTFPVTTTGGGAAGTQWGSVAWELI